METIDTNHVICNGNSMQAMSIVKVAEKSKILIFPALILKESH